jgi:large subunit ribosomal protein L29
MADKTNYREMEEKELRKIRDEHKAKLRELRFEKVIGSNFNLTEYKQAKRDIARINTLLRERELGIVKAKEEK